MHLNSLQIKNFRALEDFEVSKLGRINLIVGKNNSGKSSVLEALRIYAGNASPALLEEIALGHDEKFRVSDEETAEVFELPFENFFSGREFPISDGAPSEIGESGESSKKVAIEHVLLRTIKETIEQNGETITREHYAPVVKSEVMDGVMDFDGHSLLVTKGELFRFFRIDSNASRKNRIWFDQSTSLPCSYIPTQFISMDELADIWDLVQFAEHGDFVKEGLKLIDKNFDTLAFVKAESGYTRLGSLINKAKYDLRRTAKVKLSGVEKPISLNSMGDGMLRVLQLLLKVFPAKGGILLIDEFENGLHYSVQEDLWRYLFNLAELLDIQVFATTHSWDCIESFAKVAKEREDVDGVLFRVGRSVRSSDKGRVIATVFSEEQLFEITQADVEVR